MKYELIRSIIQNGDICEFKTWDNRIYFGFYMDGYIYRTQDNGVVAGLGGAESNIINIRRPKSMRNAFACFKHGDLYNYDYTKYGEFETVYSEPELPSVILSDKGMFFKYKNNEYISLEDLILILNNNKLVNIDFDKKYTYDEIKPN
jgi:hypothetical protein